MTRPNRRWIRAVTALAIVISAGPIRASAAPFEFMAIGDMPYGATDSVTPSPQDLQGFDRLIDAINRRVPAFTVHVGDIKKGSAPCQRRYFEIIRVHFDRFADAMIYTPGDNEWTDCYRSPAGLQPQAALEAVRAVFFSDPRQSLGRRPLPLVTQGDRAAYRAFVENARWQQGGVVFATLHVVGENDNLPDTAAGDIAEQTQRSAAARAWLAETFSLARQSGAPGVALFMQADPWQLPRGSGRESAYTGLLLALEREVAAFQGAVLLVHGDGHTYCINHPLRVKGRVAGSFTRVQVFGDGAVHGVLVVVDPGTPQVFFPSTFIVEGNPIRAEDSRCPEYRP